MNPKLTTTIRAYLEDSTEIRKLRTELKLAQNADALHRIISEWKRGRK